METNVNELIVVKQLPEIISALEEVSQYVKQEVSTALAMECSEDTVKDVKKKRAELNKQFNELESRRKDVKNMIMEKYNEFEDIYKDKISIIYKDADFQLKEKIDLVENSIKKEKEDEIREFAYEHIKSKHLENILSYEKFNINVTKSASMKSLKDSILSFIERIEKDIKLIDLEEYKDEILVEYKDNLDFMESKMTVIERHKKLEEVKKEKEEVQVKVNEDRQAVEVIVEEITTPIVVSEEDDEQEVSFTVYATVDKLKKLKEFMIREGIKYE